MASRRKSRTCARGAQHHVDARRALAKAMQARQQPAIGERRERGEGEHAVGALGAHARGGFAQQIEAGRQLG